MGKKVLPPHKQLVKAKHKARWSTEQVADALNLPSKTIQLLENGDYSSLHGSVYIISYIKAYAVLFSLDGEALVQQYREQFAEAPRPQQFVEPAMHTGKLSAFSQHRQYRSVYGLLAALVLIGVVGFFMAEPVEPIKDNIETLSAEQVDESADNQLLQSEPVLEVSSASSMATQIAKEASVSDVDEALLSSVSFEFSEDCWVEVIDGEGKKLVADLKKAQDSLELRGKPPFHVTLGYAPGVSLSYNGQPVTIARTAKYKKLVLGNS